MTESFWNAESRMPLWTFPGSSKDPFYGGIPNRVNPCRHSRGLLEEIWMSWANFFDHVCTKTKDEWGKCCLPLVCYHNNSSFAYSVYSVRPKRLAKTHGNDWPNVLSSKKNNNIKKINSFLTVLKEHSLLLLREELISDGLCGPYIHRKTPWIAHKQTNPSLFII